ncbi:MAG TPA: EamA family transporter [Pyrinomonadaceae bacterium]|nr:EamA family transporter [Pyrinomonadaceae bacterium]
MSERAKAISNFVRRQAAVNIPPILFVVAAALLWSTGGLFIKATSLSVFEVSLGRSLLAAATVAFFTRGEGFRLNRVTALSSVFYAGMLLLFVVATKLTTAANAIFLQYTAPIYIMILEPLLYKERFRARDLAVIAACVAGMSLFFVGQIEADGRLGNLAALISGVCFALFALLLRHPKTGEVNRASSVIYGNLLLASIAALSLLFAPALTRSAGRVSIGDLMAVIYLGVVQIGLAYTLFTLGIARGVRSFDAGIVGYVEPVLNPVWVFLFIGECPSRWAILGGAIIITAVILHTLYGAKTKSNERDTPRASEGVTT